jgi:hypothetical protein
VTPPATTPEYDISDLVPLFIDLDWLVDKVTLASNACLEVNFIFRMVNHTSGGNVDTSIFSIVNTTSGLQRLRVWTQSIPAAKLWDDIRIEARLQGDLV